MPIRPEFRHFYNTAEWREARERVLKRAKNRCENCGKPRHKVIFTYTWQTWYCTQFPFGRGKLYHMAWIPADGSPSLWRNQRGEVCRFEMKGLPRKVFVRLTVAHYDNEPSNMDDSNLRCWCTWCHLHHDQPHHKQTRCDRKDASRPLLKAGKSEHAIQM